MANNNNNNNMEEDNTMNTHDQMLLNNTVLTKSQTSNTKTISTDEEHALSQKFSQLNASSNIDMSEEEKSLITIDFDNIPEYLCNTNPLFEKKMKYNLTSTIKLEELRDIAILMHKIMSIGIFQSLWIMYQKSGMGNLPVTLLSSSSSVATNTMNVKVWPQEVQSLLKHSQKTYANIDQACLMFVTYYLNDLNMKNDQYRQELYIKTSHLRHYSNRLEQNIEKFIQENLQILRMETDGNIARVQYDYIDQIFHNAYLAQNPDENQIQLMKHLCKLKFHQEMTKYEVDFLKAKMSSHLTSHPFECESFTESSLINRITNKELQKQLYKQYKNVAEQARMKMMTNYLECAQGQQQQSQQQYDNEMKDIEKTELLTPLMWDIIKQRLANISTRIECLYKFKTDLLHFQLNIH